VLINNEHLRQWTAGDIDGLISRGALANNAARHHGTLHLRFMNVHLALTLRSARAERYHKYTIR